jgi:hypothetical protein
MVLGARPILEGRGEAAETVNRAVSVLVSAVFTAAVIRRGRVTGLDGQRVTTVAHRHGACPLWSRGVQWAC